MATKTFKGRIQNKHDTEANWNAAVNFKPLAGELIIYDKDNTHSTPRFKVGDGNTLVDNLPFVSDNLNTLEAKLNENIVKDPSKTYLVWKGNQFPNSTNATFTAPAGCVIDWGDGVVETFSTASTTVNTHTYTDGIEYHLISLSNYTVVYSAAFMICSSLTSIAIGNSVTSIGSGAFYDCSGLTSVTIPNSVTSIESNAFSSCSGLTSVTIPNSVTSIESNAFSSCSGLTNITIPDSVTSIGDSTFSSCSGLTSVTIPDSVTSIGASTFSSCSGLKTIKILAINPPTLYSNTFNGTSVEKIIVPKSAINDYKSAAGWSTYADKIVYEVDSSDISDTSNFAKLSGNNTFSGSNTFTGSNKFTQKPRFNSGFQLGFTASAPEVNDLWEIDKEGFKAAGSSLSTQTIKFPDLSTFFTANHTIPLSDTNNIFTGINTFKGISGANYVKIEPTGMSIHSDIGATPSVILFSDYPERLCIKSETAGREGYIQFPTIDLTMKNVETVALRSDIDVTAAGDNTFTGSNTYYGDYSALGAYYPTVQVDSGILKVGQVTSNNDANHTPTGTFASSTDYGNGSITYRPNSTTYVTYVLPSRSGTLALTKDITTVVANPTASGTTTLTKLTVGNITYNIPSGGSGDVTAAGNNTFTGNNIFTGDFSRKTRDSSGVIYYKESISDQGFTVGVGGTEAASSTQAIYGFGSIRVTAGAAGTGTLYLPVKTDTLATIDDIPIKTATLSGTTLSITLS